MLNLKTLKSNLFTYILLIYFIQQNLNKHVNLCFYSLWREICRENRYFIGEKIFICSTLTTEIVSSTLVQLQPSDNQTRGPNAFIGLESSTKSFTVLINVIFYNSKNRNRKLLLNKYIPIKSTLNINLFIDE